jgi:hypothetical protein
MASVNPFGFNGASFNVDKKDNDDTSSDPEDRRPMEDK